LRNFEARAAKAVLCCEHMKERVKTYLTPGLPGRLARKLLLARLALFFERLWQGLLAPLMLVGLFVLLVATGALLALPEWPRFAPP